MIFFRLENNIDTSSLLKEINLNYRFWKHNTIRQDTIEVQKETLSISLRKGIKEKDIHINNCHDSCETELYQFYPNIKKYMNTFIEKYGGEIGRIMVVLLPSQKMVYPHIDEGEYYKARDRFHFVLSGSYEYTVEKEVNLFQQGELWFFDNQKIHFAKTVSEKERISIIFDVKNSNWRNFYNLI